VPDAPLLVLELAIATPPIETATAAAPATTTLGSLRENMSGPFSGLQYRASPGALRPV
jgi:hypothetical protein